MPGKLPVLGRPASLDNSRARAYCVAVGAGRVVWTFFLSSIFSLFCLPLLETARYRLKYCLKGPLNPKQPADQNLKNMHNQIREPIKSSLIRVFNVNHSSKLFGT